MSNIIQIGDTPIRDISQADILAIANIEGAHLVKEHNGEMIWSEPIVLDFTNTMFSDTVVIDYQQKRLSDGIEGKVIVFFLNHKEFRWHWHFQGDEHKTPNGKNLRIESIKYLIKQGYDVPIYSKNN